MMTKEEMPACPVATTVELIGSKWKLLIMRNLLVRPWLFNELRRDLEGISQKVLTDSLRSMEEDGITFNGEPFVFDKDFFMLFPQDMDEGILNEITAAMQKVCENPDFQAELANLLYSNVTAEDADLEASRAFIENKAAIAQEIIDVAPTLDELT